ncbi:Uncharacterized protein T07_15123 [Trichinella nelsoni]|uniref:Uncharacterized protein n=1 Tax=Trichinella nelsoni TaxID=6336 RepID=A0A0V0S583_9BILA|nr:Uncharacterized protein T07_15123 [Trichinella nelsoni]
MSERKRQRNDENACDIGLKFCRSFRRFRFNLMKIQEKCERISQTCSQSIDVIKISNLEKLTEENSPIDVEVSSIFTEDDFFSDFQRMPTLTRNSQKSCFTCSNDATYCLRSTFGSFLENEVYGGGMKKKSKGFRNFLRGNIVDIARWPHCQRMVDNVYIPKATYSIITVLDGVHPFDNGNGFQKIPLNEAYVKNKLFLNRMHFYQLWGFELENLEMAGFYPEVGNQCAVENEESLQLELRKRRLRLVKYTSMSLLFGRKAFLLIIAHSLLKMLLNTLIDESLNMDYALDKVEDNIAELNLNSNDSNGRLDIKLSNEEKDEDEEQLESAGRLICNIDSLICKESNSKTGDSEFEEFIISDDGISYSADSSKMQSLFNKRTEELEKLERHYAESQALLTRSKHECSELRNLFEQTKQEQTGKISLLENELKEKEKQIRLLKDNLSTLEAHCRKTVSDCEANFLLQKEQLLKSSEIAEREKNNAVVKYAQREKEILVLESSNQKLQQQIRQLISDRDALGSQLRASKNVRDGLVTACEKKVKSGEHWDDLEISNLRKEADRLKFQIQEGDVRLKIAYKKNDELVEALRVSNSELDRLKSELSNFGGKLIDDKTTNATAGVENANDSQKCSAYSSLPDESLHLQERLRELEECNLSKENCIDELRSKLSEHENTLEEQKKQIDQLSDELEQLNGIESKWQACQRDLANLESDCQQAELEANECRQETERLLQLVETLTNSNTLLKTENLTLTSKVQSLENADSSNSEIVERLNQRLTNLEEEYLEHQRNARTEVESLEALLSEKAQLERELTTSLLDEQNTIKVLKRKHQAYAKELKAEICILKRRLDNYESSAASQCSGSSVADEHSRAPSPSSWSCSNINNGNSNNNALPNGEDVQAEYHHPATTTTTTTFNHVQTTVCEHNQLMIEKIVKLQRALARRNEKIEFLEEHMKSLFHEIRKKTKIIQSYVIREEAGMLTSATFDMKKTVMSNLFSTGMSNREINLELAVEMLRKLQAVLEDTLLKNITFKESVDTLGEEIARLSRENRDLKLKLAGMAVLVVSIWLLLDRDVAQHMIELDARLQEFYVTIYILLAVGVVMSLFGFMGCCGALRKSKCLLIAFFILLVIVFCAELTCGILAYTHQEQVKQYIEKSMYETVLSHYGRNNPYTETFDTIQRGLKCCGVKSYTDWLQSYYSTKAEDLPELGVGAGNVGRVPLSCCSDLGLREHDVNCGVTYDKQPLFTYEPYLNTQGCLPAVYGKFYQNLDLVIGLAVGIGCFQLIGMLFSMLLCCWIDKKKRQEYKTGGY